eukprot:9044625-Pyramimonas_sp.AAC.1
MGVGSRDVRIQHGDARLSPCIEALVAREISSDNAALRCASPCIAGLPARRPALTFGCLPTEKGALEMASVIRLSSK